MSNVSDRLRAEVSASVRRLYNMDYERGFLFSQASLVLGLEFPERSDEFEQRSNYTASQYIYVLNEFLDLLHQRENEGRLGEYFDEDRLASMDFTPAQFLESLRVEIEQVKAVEDARHEASLNEIVENFNRPAVSGWEEANPEALTEKDHWAIAVEYSGANGFLLGGRVGRIMRLGTMGFGHVGHDRDDN